MCPWSHPAHACVVGVRQLLTCSEARNSRRGDGTKKGIGRCSGVWRLLAGNGPKKKPPQSPKEAARRTNNGMVGVYRLTTDVVVALKHGSDVFSQRSVSGRHASQPHARVKFSARISST